MSAQFGESGLDPHCRSPAGAKRPAKVAINSASPFPFSTKRVGRDPPEEMAAPAQADGSQAKGAVSNGWIGGGRRPDPPEEVVDG